MGFNSAFKELKILDYLFAVTEVSGSGA